MSKIGVTYTLSFVVSLVFLVVMGTFAFFNQPLYIRFRLMTPELIVAITFFVLLICSSIFQVLQLLKIEKKIHWFDFSVIALSLIAFFANILVFIAVPLAIIAFIRQAASKRTVLKITLFGFLGFLLTPVFALIVFVAWGSATQLDTNESTSFTIMQNAKDDIVPVASAKKFNIYSWNIGYASTGSEMAYFYDSDDKGNPGWMGKADNKPQVIDHLAGINQFVSTITSENGGSLNSPDGVSGMTTVKTPFDHSNVLPRADFGVFQEVDREGVRSMYTDQTKILSKNMNGFYDSQFTRNIKDGILPVPFLDPGGQLESGEFSFSHYKIKDASRVSLKSAGTGLDGIFNLKRAIGLTEYELDNGGTLYVGDLHMSAFPQDHAKRDKEFETLIDKLTEWTKDPNNRVIIGGDWNTDLTEQYWYKKADKNDKTVLNTLAMTEKVGKENILGGYNAPYMLNSYDIAKYPSTYRKFITNNPGWTLGVDNDVNNPSMRLAATPWLGHNSKNLNEDLGIIDGFLVSKGVKVDETKTIQQGWHQNMSNPDHPYLFADSDHNPVRMEFELV